MDSMQEKILNILYVNLLEPLHTCSAWEDRVKTEIKSEIQGKNVIWVTYSQLNPDKL